LLVATRLLLTDHMVTAKKNLTTTIMTMMAITIPPMHMDMSIKKKVTNIYSKTLSLSFPI
jgi:hypothetical protein